MNELNYGSKEVCEKLVKAGIVMETEVFWIPYEYPDHREWRLYSRGCIPHREEIPAPSMAEMWRELPEHVQLGDMFYDLFLLKTNETTFASYGYEEQTEVEVHSINPADALIDLRIWLEEQKKCIVTPYSSRTCERGTKSCEVEHK
jgi:hypothetical protein